MFFTLSFCFSLVHSSRRKPTLSFSELDERNDFEFSPRPGFEFSSYKQIDLSSSFVPFLENVRCLADKLYQGKVKAVFECKAHCIANVRCNFYAYWREKRFCETYEKCTHNEIDGNNIINVYKRMNECDYLHDEYVATISAQFTKGLVRTLPPDKNFQCTCTTRQWMFCAIFTAEGSPEEMLINQRLSRTQPEEDLEPFQIMVSQTGTASTPIGYVSRERFLLDKNRGSSVAAEIRVMSHKQCLNVRQCLEGTPASSVSHSQAGSCPLKLVTFRPGDPVYIMNSEVDKAIEGQPVACISMPGLRSFGMHSGRKGFIDPFDRSGKNLFVKTDFTMFVLFDDRDFASGICQDNSLKVSEVGKKEKRRRKKSGGASSDSHSSASDLPSFSFGSPQVQDNSPSLEEIGPASTAMPKPESVSDFPTLVEKETERDSSSESHRSTASDITPRMGAMSMDLVGPSQPYEEDGPEWTTVSSRSKKRESKAEGSPETSAKAAGKQPVRAVSAPASPRRQNLPPTFSTAEFPAPPTYVEKLDVSDTSPSSPADPLLGPGQHARVQRKSPTKRVYRTKKAPNLRRNEGHEAFSSPITFKATATIGTMTDADPHAASGIAESSTQTLTEPLMPQVEQSTMTEPLMSHTEQSTMTDPSISQSEQSTMTRPLTMKDLFHFDPDQVVLQGDDSGPEDRISISLHHTFNIFNMSIVLILLFTIFNIYCKRRHTMHDQSVYVYFQNHEV